MDERTSEGAVTRAEEELVVDKQDVDAGEVRLHKTVETQPVSVDVDLHHEAARITREPVDEPVADAAFDEQEVEVPLRAEEAVVEKQAVAKERVGVEKHVETEHQTVLDEVRRERVEVEGGDAA